MKIVKDNDSHAVELYWNDLTTDTQMELTKIFGGNENYDVFPIAILPLDEDYELKEEES
jgi:hypothetical protein